MNNHGRTSMFNDTEEMFNETKLESIKFNWHLTPQRQH